MTLTNKHQASAPVAVLIISWLFGVANPKLKIFFNVIVIVFGVALASFVEIEFVWLGFFYQMGGIVFEAIRLIMIQILLSGEGQNMDPLVSLYYYAPVCALMNAFVAVVMESGTFKMDDVWRVGVTILLANAGVAFLLNVASVFLVRPSLSLAPSLANHSQISKERSSLTTPDRQNLRPSNDPLRRPKEYSLSHSLRPNLGHYHNMAASSRVRHSDRWTDLLWRRLRRLHDLFLSHQDLRRKTLGRKSRYFYGAEREAVQESGFCEYVRGDCHAVGCGVGTADGDRESVVEGLNGGGGSVMEGGVP